MHIGKMVFSQIMEFLPSYEFNKCVERYRGNHYVKNFSCLDQFLAMAFAQLTYRESLRDIEVCLRSMQSKLYHLGIRGTISRNTLAKANENRDWRIYADFANLLISTARGLYANDDFGLELKDTVYALDATTIDLCLALFPWAKFRKNKGGIKLHTLLDLRGNIPAFLLVTSADTHEVNVLDTLIPEPGSFYVMDRGYIDFSRLYSLHQARSFFVIRAKDNLRCRRLCSRQVNRSSGLICDQTVSLTGILTHERYPENLRRIKYHDRETDVTYVYLTNNTELPAMTIADLYRSRWQVELFFKWIKQHLRIKAFYGTSDNAVKTQVWIAIAVYVLIAIIKKRLKLNASLYTILQILSVTLFEKTPILQALQGTQLASESTETEKQLNLFTF
jgi:hypothetical protein